MLLFSRMVNWNIAFIHWEIEDMIFIIRLVASFSCLTFGKMQTVEKCCQSEQIILLLRSLNLSDDFQTKCTEQIAAIYYPCSVTFHCLKQKVKILWTRNTKTRSFVSNFSSAFNAEICRTVNLHLAGFDIAAPGLVVSAPGIGG